MTETIRLENGVELVIDRAKKSCCKACKAEFYWGRTAFGRTMPVDMDLKKSHFATCTSAGQFRRPK